MGQGLVNVPYFGDFEHFQVFLGDYILNIWVMFNHLGHLPSLVGSIPFYPPRIPRVFSPWIRGMNQGYFSGDLPPQNMAKHMVVTYLRWRILEFPVIEIPLKSWRNHGKSSDINGISWDFMGFHGIFFGSILVNPRPLFSLLSSAPPRQIFACALMRSPSPRPSVRWPQGSSALAPGAASKSHGGSPIAGWFIRENPWKSHGNGGFIMVYIGLYILVFFIGL